MSRPSAVWNNLGLHELWNMSRNYYNEWILTNNPADKHASVRFYNLYRMNHGKKIDIAIEKIARGMNHDCYGKNVHL